MDLIICVDNIVMLSHIVDFLIHYLAAYNLIMCLHVYFSTIPCLNFEGYIPVLVMVSIDCFTDLDIVILVALWRIIVFLFPV